MAKTLNSRIQYQYDEKDNWAYCTDISLKGEIYVHADGGIAQHVTVGDGGTVNNAPKLLLNTSSLIGGGGYTPDPTPPSEEPDLPTPSLTKIEKVPSQKNTLTFMYKGGVGFTQEPTWNDYDESVMLIGGTTSAGDAGTHAATFTPKEGYCWSDGSIEQKIVEWKIAKAEYSLGIAGDNTSIITNPNSTVPLAIYYIMSDENPTVTCSSSNEEYITCHYDSIAAKGYVICHPGTKNGTATITVTIAETKNYKETTCTYDIKNDSVIESLNSTSWSKISQISKDGNARNYFELGDTKSITVSGTIGNMSNLSFTTDVVILDFSHAGTVNTDTDASGSINFALFGRSSAAGFPARFTCLIDDMYDSMTTQTGYCTMITGTSVSNSNGWRYSYMRNAFLGSTKTANAQNAPSTTATLPVSGSLMAALPSDLRAVMQPMTVRTDNVAGGTNKSANVTTTTDYLPLLAEYEFYGENYNANTYEPGYQTQYAFFAMYPAGQAEVESLNGIQSHIGYGYDGMPGRSIWFRSPCRSDGVRFCMSMNEISSPVNASSVADRLSSYGGIESAVYSLGVAPIFTV